MIDSLKILKEYKNAIQSLVLKNLKGQYRNTKLGFLWQVINPLFTVLLFYIVFTSIRVTNDPKYWLFLSSGIIPYSFISLIIIGGTSCMISNGGMIKKINLPKIVYVYSLVIGAFIVFLISFAILITLSIVTNDFFKIEYYGYLLALLAIMFLTSIGTVCLLSTIGVMVRDFVPFINMISRALFWFTPIVYKIETITGALSTLIWYNPITHFIVSFQKVLYYNELDWYLLLNCLIICVIVCIIGLLIFNKLSNKFVERL